MEKEHRQRILGSVEAAFANAGINLYAGAARLKRFIDANYALLAAAQDREHLDQYLEPFSDIDADKLQQIMMLFTALPELGKALGQETVQKAAAEVPGPDPGRPAALQVDAKRQIIAYVGDLHTKGVQLRLAQERAAQRFNCSLRSVQRVWRERQLLADDPFQAISDVVRFLSE